MEKKVYVMPITLNNRVAIENLMLTASPGVDGEYDPSKPIEGKAFDFFDAEESETGAESSSTSLWYD